MVKTADAVRYSSTLLNQIRSRQGEFRRVELCAECVAFESPDSARIGYAKKFSQCDAAPCGVIIHTLNFCLKTKIRANKRIHTFR